MQAPTLSLYLLAPNLYRLVLLVIAIAGIQAALGLMQFGSGPKSLLYLGSTCTHFDSGVGIYTNRNHLAGLIKLVLPVMLALFLYSFGRNERRYPRSWRGDILFLSTLRGHAAFLCGVLVLLLLLGMIFTRSRTGISLTILGVLAVTFSLGRRIGGNNFSDPDQQAVSGRRHSRQRQSPDSMQTATPAGPVVKPMEPASDQIRNPFLD